MIKKQKPYKRLKEKVKTAKKRKISSTRWLQRQLNDPYVKAIRWASDRIGNGKKRGICCPHKSARP